VLSIDANTEREAGASCFITQQTRKKDMEILVFGLIAMRNAYKQETFVREPDEFQPFDVWALAHLYNVRNDSSKLTTDPTPSLTAQVAS
jgi:hypothetical protein